MSLENGIDKDLGIISCVSELLVVEDYTGTELRSRTWGNTNNSGLGERRIQGCSRSQGKGRVLRTGV